VTCVQGLCRLKHESDRYPAKLAGLVRVNMALMKEIAKKVATNGNDDDAHALLL
jgi:hypothetical protein